MKCIIYLAVIMLPAIAACKQVHITRHNTIETIMILRAISPDDYFLKRIASDKKGRPMLYLARQRFARFKDHPAVARTQQMLDGDLGGRLFQGVAYAEELPGTAIVQKPADAYWQRHLEELKSYMQILGEFYKTAGVENFLTQNDTFYRNAESEAAPYIHPRTINVLETYFGSTNSAYYLYLMPMCPYGWGFSLTTSDKGKLVQHAVVSPVANIVWDGNSPFTEYGFGGASAAEHYRDLVVHEFVHSFITNVIDRNNFRLSISQYDTLLTPLLDSMMKNQAYDGWWSFINEQLVRTGEIRATSMLDTNAAERMRHLNYNEYKFVLLPEMEALMKQYEQNRKKYNTIEDFIPVLIDGLKYFSRIEIDRRILSEPIE